VKGRNEGWGQTAAIKDLKTINASDFYWDNTTTGRRRLHRGQDALVKANLLEFKSLNKGKTE